MSESQQQPPEPGADPQEEQRPDRERQAYDPAEDPDTGPSVTGEISEAEERGRDRAAGGEDDDEEPGSGGAT